ncbi:MAG: gliding motility-associated C-terminal domain-containing protein [Bacteroidales bacterium]|nr:gliding motility-associated C-terminal domain-containing protein [Bacteroidales bacterium]
MRNFYSKKRVVKRFLLYIAVSFFAIPSFSQSKIDYERLELLRSKQIDEMTFDEREEYASLKASGADVQFYTEHQFKQLRSGGESADFCNQAIAFCTDEGSYSFPAGTSDIQATDFSSGGTNIACCYTTPSPAWFYMRIDNPGDLLIYMEHSNGYDIDFVCWGPFTASTAEELLSSRCTGGLNTSTDNGSHRPSNGNHSGDMGGYPTGNIIDCSYTTEDTEWCYIPNAQSGQWYIFLITNYSKQAGTILFNSQHQSWLSGQATTDCNIIANVNSNSPVCEGATITLSCSNVNNATSYRWFFNGANQTATGTQIGTGTSVSRLNATTAMTGWYELQITTTSRVNSFYTYVIVTPKPQITTVYANPAEICSGDEVQLSVSADNADSYFWSNGANNASTTSNPTSTTRYYVTVTNTTSSFNPETNVNQQNSCSDVNSVNVTVHPSPTVAIQPGYVRLCAGDDVMLSTVVSNCDNCQYSWDTGASTSEISVSPNTTTTYIVTVSTQLGCSGTASVSVEIIDVNSMNDCNVVYVEVNGDGSGMTPSDPTDISSALRMSECSGAIIRMAEGVYEIDYPLELVSNVTIEGGYFDNFNKKKSTAGATTIRRTNTNVLGSGATPSVIALKGDAVHGFRLQDLTIETQDARNDIPASNLDEGRASTIYSCSGWSFETASSTYTSIPHNTNTQVGSFGDDASLPITLPFDFTLCGTTYFSGTQIYVCSNGFINFDDAPSGTLSAPSTSSVLALLHDLYPPYSGNIYSNYSGGVLTIEWYNIVPYSTSCRTSSYAENFQIKLYQGSNIIEICYGNINPCTETTLTPRVGVRDGQTGTSKYVNVSSSWASPTTVESAVGCTFNETCKPASGLVYRFFPADLTPSEEQVVIETNFGVSNYAVYLKSCTNYEIVRCQLKPGTAGNGKQGRQGNPGAAANGRTHGGSGAQQGGDGATAGGGIGSNASNSNGTNGKGGNRGTNGTNADAGTYCDAENGGTGGNGGAGSAGITGETGSIRTIVNSDFGELFAPGISGNGGAGYGGGGGGAGGTGGRSDCSNLLWQTDQSNGGAGGAGGVGGAGVRGAECDYTCDGTVYGGYGGSGGNGGAGGAGGRGGQGATGVAYKIANVSNTGLISSESTGYNFNLSGQDEIIAGSDEYPIASCTGIPIAMNGITFTSFGSGATPSSGASGTTTTYSTTGFKTPAGASGNYSGFVNMIQAAPTLPQVGMEGNEVVCCTSTHEYCLVNNVPLDPSIVINWSVTSSVAEITSVTTGQCVEVSFNNTTDEIQYAILRAELSTSCCGIVKVVIDTVTVKPEIHNYDLGDDIIACEGENISLSINVNGNLIDENMLCNAAYQWRLNGSEIGNSNTPILELNNVVPENTGTYTAYIVTDCGIESAETNVTINPAPSVEVTGIEPVCTGNPSTFTINATAHGSTINGATVTYTLSVGEDSEEFTVTTPANASHNITTSTLLTITSVSIPNECSAQLNQMYNLVLYNDVTDLTAGDDINICGTQHTLDASWPSSEWLASWVLPDGITIDEIDSPIATITYTGTTFPYDATLQWRLESQNCPGSVVTDDVIVTFATAPTITPASAAPANACFFQDMTELTFEYGGGATGVNVTGFPAYGISYEENGNQIVIGGNANDVGTIHYTITSTGQNEACPEASVSGDIIIDYCDIPIDGPSPICQGETATYSTIVPGTYYSWTVNGGTILSGQGSESITVQWTEAGDNTINIALTGTNAQPTSHTIVVNPAYNTIINASICEGDTYEENGFSETEQGTHVHEFQTINGCDSIITLNLTVNTNPVIEITETDVTCYGFGNGIVSANVSGGSGSYSYAWSNTSQTTSTITSLEPNRYNVTVTDNATHCTSTASATIEQPDAMRIPLTSNDVQCGISLGNASVNVSGGEPPYTYRWSTGSIESAVENLQQGDYSVTVTDANNCTLSQSTTIRNIGIVTAEIEEQSPIKCFGTNTGILTVTSETAAQPFSCIWNNGASYQTNFNIGAGTYSVTITDAWGCQGNATYTITEPPIMNVSSSVTHPKCFGDRTGKISANATGGTTPYTMLWSTGSGANEITGLVAGSYALTVTDANGCSNVSNFTINWPEELTVEALTTDITCYGGAGGKITATAGGGTAPYEYYVHFGNLTFSNGTSYDGLRAGIYTVNVVDINKCTASTSISIKEPEQIKVNTIVTAPSCTGGRDGSIEIEVTGGIEPYTYAWANSSNETNLVTDLIQGTYSITITDANECRITMNSLALIDHVGDCIKIPNVFTPNEDGVNDTWIIENIWMFPEAYIYVYNRWGQLMYEGRGTDEPWDGRYRGHYVPSGTYMYIVNLENLEKDRAYTGTVTILY